jgi:hypothetical protein
MSNEKIILEENAESFIEQVTLDVWKVSDKKYFLNKEKAINDVITHKKCDCGNLIDKYRNQCTDCQRKNWGEASITRYNNKPFLEWDGETMLCLFDDDKFFSDESEVLDYLAEENDSRDEDDKLKIEDLQLCICAPNNAPLIDYEELCEDIIPENVDDLSQIAPEILKRVNELNEFIKTHKPISWTEGPFKTTLK